MATRSLMGAPGVRGSLPEPSCQREAMGCDASGSNRAHARIRCAMMTPPSGGVSVDEQHKGKFSEGEETEPDSPEKERVGRFSDGEEAEPDSPEKEHVGRFSEGEETEPDSPEK